MLARIILMLCIGSIIGFNFAQPMRIGLFPTQKFAKVKFANATGTFYLIADTSFLGTLDYFSFCEVSKGSAGSLEVVFQGVKKTGIKQLRIISSMHEKSIEFSGISPVLKARAFEGDFEIKQSNGSLLIVNMIDLEHYLEGVVESEAGTGQKMEYYKVQAIISRTFALKSKQKHEKEGFNLCNQVHCQAYLHKRNGSAAIDSAVMQTKHLILLQPDSTFAPTFFSANCGGQTCEPSMVWNASIDGLESTVDTFCVYTKQAKWVKKISRSEWERIMVGKYHFPIDDSLSKALLYHWESPYRTSFLIHPGFGIPMRDLREKFDLKSSFFSVHSEGEFVLLEGRGYGHGVGLCQEGAMKMAKSGFKFDQILRFYFPSFNLGLSYFSNF